MYLFDDTPSAAFRDPVVIGGALIAALAILYGAWMRARLARRPRRSPAYDVFRRDVAAALLTWGVAQATLAVGSLAQIEGLRMPIWSYLGLAVGLALVVLAWRRERVAWPSAAKGEGAEALPDGRVQRGTSRTWEMAIVLAGGVALTSYLATVDHRYGHPIHWLTTAIMALAGYALGLAIWSPRLTLSLVRAKQPRAAEQRRGRNRGSPRGQTKRPNLPKEIDE